MPRASDEITLQLGDKQFSKRIPDIQEVEPAVANDYDDQLSHDSASTDEGAANQNDLCLTMMQLFQCKEGQAKYFDIESKVGLQGSQTCWSYPCIQDAAREKFFVWMGDVPLDRFTKTTFLNLVNFAENAGAKHMILTINREHEQKDKFQRLFKVLDAERVSKRGMKELMGEDGLEENALKYALYKIALE
jgi:hypothetical protein